MNRVRNQIPPLLAAVIDRAVYIIVMAIVAWVLGVMKGEQASKAIIKKLDADIVNLEAGVDYYRK